MDQANTLRQIIGHQRSAQRPRRAERGRMRVIAITSGKGGVGKTNTVLNLSLALSRLQRKVFLLDADMGLANVDVLLGLTPRHTLEHVMDGLKDISDVVVEGPLGLKILPSSSGISELSEMTFEQQMHLFRELSRLDDEIDYLFIDTGAGISSNVLRFNASANEVYLVVNPEPTSITDAYALMKLLAIKYHVHEFGLIANAVSSEQDGLNVFQRLHRVSQQFLRVHLNYLGSIPFDKHIRKAVRQQRALMELFPQSPAGRSITRIAALVDQGGLLAGVQPPPPAPAPASVNTSFHTSFNTSAPSPSEPASAGFWDRLLHWKKVK
jgi:flagellar biosynthesis protein FlhG